MLNQGRGIVDAPETCFLKETTEKEQAEHPFGSVRYVYSVVVNLFENEMKFPEQVDYAVETDMDMLDFDEWQGIQEILFGEGSGKAMKPECARAINTALWEYHDISQYEILERYDGLFCGTGRSKRKSRSDRSGKHGSIYTDRWICLVDVQSMWKLAAYRQAGTVLCGLRTEGEVP